MSAQVNTRASGDKMQRERIRDQRGEARNADRYRWACASIRRVHFHG
jgi:hypothetical protein